MSAHTTHTDMNAPDSDTHTPSQLASSLSTQRRNLPIGLDWTQSSVSQSSYDDILRAMFPSLSFDAPHSSTIDLLSATSIDPAQLVASNDRPGSQVRRTRMLQRPFAGLRRGPQSNPSIHPQFRAKSVCKLFCKHCDSDLCMRGMKAILLGNTKVELFSTDTPPLGVQLVYGDYMTQNCACKIKDAACLGCGYHVTQPCESCLEACNNGHFWMFHSDGVGAIDRIDNGRTLKWAELTLDEQCKDVKVPGPSACNMLCR